MRNLGLALLTSVLLILTFPRFNIVWFAPIALTPLVIAAAREPRPFRRFLLGEAAGVVYWFGVCYWIQFVLSYHGGMGEKAGWATFLLFCVAKALHMAVFTWLAGYLMEKSWTIPAIAALWVGIERTHGPLGFAWMALGNAGIDMSLPMRLAPWVGVYGLSFIFAMLATAMAVAYLRRGRAELLWLVILLALFFHPALPEAQTGSEQAVAVQPNQALDETWTTDSAIKMRKQLASISLQSALAAGEQPPRMILWPEVPAPLYYGIDARFKEEANTLARAANTYFLFGTVAFTSDGAPLNSAQLLSPEGEPVLRYDKMYLVPFGEFVPPLFGFVNRITKEAGDFVPGSELKVMPVDGHGVGTFICYEAVFPHLVRRFAASGAEVFVNLSNDGYFGRSAAREQHLLIARMRAAENRRWILRATNDGITVAIDPAGRIRQQLEPYIQTATRLNFDYEDSLTSYTRHGDWFAWFCLAASLGAVLILRLQRR